MVNLTTSDIKVALLASAATSLVIWAWFSTRTNNSHHDDDGSTTNQPVTDSSSCYEKLIGNTPLVRLDTLSKLLKRSIFVKMESLNPGGTGKDRAAWSMIRAAEKAQQLPPPTYSKQSSAPDMSSDGTQSLRTAADTSETGSSKKGREHNDKKAYDDIIQAAGQSSRTGGIVVEGTSGSTGISLSILAASHGHGCIVVLPDDQAVEKRMILQSLGTQVQVVPTASISNPQHYVNIARNIAEWARTEWGYQAVFIDQFENTSNFQIHFEETGREIYRQCSSIDAFVMSAGTGGTISGVGKYLKTKTNGHVQIVLVDPPGSSLYNRIEHGVAYAPQQAEQGLKRHRYDTVAEGIGLDRITRNFAVGESCVDKAIRVEDQQAVDMAHWLLAAEGLFVGSSSSMNIVGAVETALSLPPGSNVVTVVCDSGQRHLTRFWNREFCLSWGLIWPGDEKDRIPECLRTALNEDRK